MRAILEFNLPEERQEFDVYYNAFNYYGALETFRELLRRWEKSGINKTQEEIRDEFYKLLNEINFE